MKKFIIKCTGNETDMSIKTRGYISPLKFAVLVRALVQTGNTQFGEKFPSLLHAVMKCGEIEGVRIISAQKNGGSHANED